VRSAYRGNCKHKLYASGQEIADAWCYAFIWHVCQRDAVHARKERAGQVRAAANTTGGIIELTRTGACIFDQFLHRLGWNAGMHKQQQWCIDRKRNGSEVSILAKGKLADITGNLHMAHIEDRQAAAVRCGTSEQFQRNISSSARTIVEHHALSPA